MVQLRRHVKEAMLTGRRQRAGKCIVPLSTALLWRVRAKRAADGSTTQHRMAVGSGGVGATCKHDKTRDAHIVTGASTRCTFDSSTNISRAFSHSVFTSRSASGSQRLSCSIHPSRSDMSARPFSRSAVLVTGRRVPWQEQSQVVCCTQRRVLRPRTRAKTSEACSACSARPVLDKCPAFCMAAYPQAALRTDVPPTSHELGIGSTILAHSILAEPF